MSDTSFSLLSQEEIDTLIEFLTEKSNNFNSEVLSQESIDKLISAMRNYAKKPVGNHSLQGSVGVRAMSTVLADADQWQLDFAEDEENGYMDIFITDGERRERITPRGYSCACFVEDGGAWGVCVSPVQFTDIAKTYHVKFSREVYTAVCQRYALKNYGDADYDMDDFFLASSKDLLACLK